MPTLKSLNLLPFADFFGKKKRASPETADTPLDVLEKQIDKLVTFVSELEVDFYSKVSLEELETEVADVELEELGEGLFVP